MFENMIEGRPFLYQAIGGNVYHIAGKGVEAVNSWSSEEPTVAFVDGDRTGYQLDGILFRQSVQVIAVSSPKGANPKWIKQLGQNSFVTHVVVDLWSYKELFLTGLVLALHSTLD